MDWFQIADVKKLGGQSQEDQFRQLFQNEVFMHYSYQPKKNALSIYDAAFCKLLGGEISILDYNMSLW